MNRGLVSREIQCRRRESFILCLVWNITNACKEHAGLRWGLDGSVFAGQRPLRLLLLSALSIENRCCVNVYGIFLLESRVVQGECKTSASS